MTNLAARRKHVNSARFIQDALAVAPDILGAISAGANPMEALGFMDRWHGGEINRGCLNDEDLLAVAILQDLPFCMDTWFAQGEPVNGDTVLALVEDAKQGFIFREPATYMPMLVNARTRPWHGVIFRAASPSAALWMVERGWITEHTPVPINQGSEWLWTHEPVIEGEDSYTLPMHCALATEKWALAEKLWDVFEDPNVPDGQGRSLRDVLVKTNKLWEFSPLTRSGEAKNMEWLRKLDSIEQARHLDEAIAQAGGESKRRRI